MIKLIYPKFWQTRTIVSYILYPLSFIYRLLAYIRKIFAKPIKFPCKVVCVGNATVGGTGKTQIVQYIAKYLKSQNINFLIVTKGFGSNLTKYKLVDNKDNYLDVGDESIMLSQCGSVVATKKISYISDLIQELKPEILIVDDFLQNPNFYKDCIILSVDQTRLFGNGFFFPAGPLRENPNKLMAKADAIIEVGLENKKSTENKFYAKIGGTLKWNLADSYFIFCGIGNPDRFLATLQNEGLKIIGSKIYPDHHDYNDTDILFLQAQSIKHKAMLITTRKDYIKIPQNQLSCLCYDVELLIDDEQSLLNIILHGKNENR